MKVLLTARHPVGGIRTFFRYIYGNSCFEEVSLDVLAPGNDLPEFFAEWIQHPKATVRTVEDNAKALFSATRRAIRAQDYDLVHSHGFTAGVLTEMAAAGQGVPHLMTAHDVFMDGQFVGLKGNIKKLLMSQIFRRVEGVHTVTDEARNNFLSFFPSVPPNRIHGILHGVDTDWFSQGKAQNLRERFDIAPDRPLIGFFGRFMAQKGFRDLVEAMRLLVDDPRIDPKPMVITFGWGGFIREDYHYLRQRGLADYFVQSPATDDMPGAIKGVDVVAMPSRWEACGLLAMEVLASGVPIVGTNCVGLNEVLSGTPAHPVSPESPRELAYQLAVLLSHADQKKPFQAYQSEAVERFRIDRPAKELRALYDAIAARN